MEFDQKKKGREKRRESGKEEEALDDKGKERRK